MKKQLLALAGFGFLMTSMPAFAGDDEWTDSWQNGWQVSIGGAINEQSGSTSKMIQGRLRKEFGDFFALEGEAAFALAQDEIAGVKTGMDNAFGGFAVAKTPQINGFELFARGGYASTQFRTDVAGVSTTNADRGFSWGGGAQYFVDDANGIRFDFTRYDRDIDNLDVYSMAYTRKF